MSFLEFPRMKNEWEWANMTAGLFINYPSLMTSRLIWSNLLYIGVIFFPHKWMARLTETAFDKDTAE